jgi:hypothetical protein
MAADRPDAKAGGTVVHAHPTPHGKARSHERRCHARFEASAHHDYDASIVRIPSAPTGRPPIAKSTSDGERPGFSGRPQRCPLQADVMRPTHFAPQRSTSSSSPIPMDWVSFHPRR